MKFDPQYWLRDYFGFSKKEINGFFILSFLLVFIIATPLFYPFFIKKETFSNQEQKELNSLLASLPPPSDNQQDYSKKSYSKKQSSKVGELFIFDPNTVSEAELLRLGFSKYLTNNFLKYRSKGVKFYRSEQIQKIYGMEEDFFVQIAPYMTFPKREKKKWDKKDTYSKYDKKDNSKYDSEDADKKPIKYKKPTLTSFEINEADTATLKKVRGIGAVLSQRIVDFREKLGGFVSLEQVKEVYGLSPEVIEELSKYALFSDKIDIKKININQASAISLSYHPYLSKKQADVIIQYRTQHGNFGSIEDLKKIKILNDDLVSKLAPYLSF
jgi:competence ComEA-like helix-hairpin-helix protein